MAITLPPTLRPAGSGTSRTSDRQVTDFPEPDSPTRASVSPAWRMKLTPSTARVTPRRVKKCVLRSSTTSSGEASGIGRCLSSASADTGANGRFLDRGAEGGRCGRLQHGGTAAELPQLRIEVITEPVAHEVDGENRQDHGQTRDERDPPRGGQEAAAIGDHQT